MIRRVAVQPGGHVLLQVPDRLVVVAKQRQQPRQGLLVRGREVDVAAPDPAPGPVGGVGAQARRLRVVDDDHVPVVVEALRVHRVVGLEHLPLLVGDRLRVALERVVHQLGDVEELLAAEDHPPVGVEADVAHQRHQRVEDLRDAAAERGRADVQHPLAGQRLGELADLLDQAAARRGACSRRASAGAEGNVLKHARKSSRHSVASVRGPPPVVLRSSRSMPGRARGRSPRAARGSPPRRTRSGTRRRSRAAAGPPRGSPVGVGDDRPGLLEDQRRRGEVVGRVVRAPRRPPTRSNSSRIPGTSATILRARLDVGVELAGDDPGHVEGRRAEVEGPAADRGGVDQLAEHLGDRPHRAAAQAVGPEHPREVGVRRQRRRRVEPAAALGDERAARLDLDHAADLARRPSRLAVGVQARGGHRHAGGLEPGHRRPGAVDRVDDQDPLGLARSATPGPGPRSRRRRPGARSARKRSMNASARSSIAKVTSPPSPAPACARPA